MKILGEKKYIKLYSLVNTESTTRASKYHHFGTLVLEVVFFLYMFIHTHTVWIKDMYIYIYINSRQKANVVSQLTNLTKPPETNLTNGEVGLQMTFKSPNPSQLCL